MEIETDKEISRLKERIAQLEGEKAGGEPSAEIVKEAIKIHAEEESGKAEKIESLQKELSEQAEKIKSKKEDSHQEGHSEAIEEFINFAKSGGVAKAAMVLQKISDDPHLMDELHDSLIAYIRGLYGAGPEKNA